MRRTKKITWRRQMSQDYIDACFVTSVNLLLRFVSPDQWLFFSGSWSIWREVRGSTPAFAHLLWNQLKDATSKRGCDALIEDGRRIWGKTRFSECKLRVFGPLAAIVKQESWLLVPYRACRMCRFRFKKPQCFEFLTMNYWTSPAAVTNTRARQAICRRRSSMQTVSFPIDYASRTLFSFITNSDERKAKYSDSWC